MQNLNVRNTWGFAYNVCMKSSCQLLVFLLLTCTESLCSQLVFSEVMFDLEGSDSPNEFVELYNLGDEAIDLASWQLADSYATDQLEGNCLCPAQQYILILEADYEGFYDTFVPPDTPLCFVDDSSIGNGLGNSNDHLYLISANGDTCAAMGWENSVPAGFSLEKVRLDFEDHHFNWRTSNYPLGTPGVVNSVQGQEVDLKMISCWHEPLFPEPEASFSIFSIVTNCGLFAEEMALQLDQSIHHGGILHPEDTIMISFEHSGLTSGTHLLELSLQLPDDYNQDNNTLIDTVLVPFEDDALLFNEIMYAPMNNSVEWIELVNPGLNPINLSGWSIILAGGIPGSGIVDEFIPSGGFQVICGDSTQFSFLYQDHFPSLANSGAHIQLYDPTGKLCDELTYDEEWGGRPGYSLERIAIWQESSDPLNWGASVAQSGNTAGELNSLNLSEPRKSGTIEFSQNPYGPNLDDELHIYYQLPFLQSSLEIILFDVRGRPLMTLASGIPTGANGSIIWDGHLDTGETCAMGQYLLHIFAQDKGSSENWSSLERLVIYQ